MRLDLKEISSRFMGPRCMHSTEPLEADVAPVVIYAGTGSGAQRSGPRSSATSSMSSFVSNV